MKNGWEEMKKARQGMKKAQAGNENCWGGMKKAQAGNEKGPGKE